MASARTTPLSEHNERTLRELRRARARSKRLLAERRARQVSGGPSDVSTRLKDLAGKYYVAHSLGKTSAARAALTEFRAARAEAQKTMSKSDIKQAARDGMKAKGWSKSSSTGREAKKIAAGVLRGQAIDAFEDSDRQATRLIAKADMKFQRAHGRSLFADASGKESPTAGKRDAIQAAVSREIERRQNAGQLEPRGRKEAEPKAMQRGKRGGRYYISKTGSKVYGRG